MSTTYEFFCIRFASENAGRTASYERAEELGVKLEQEWLSTLDGRTRHSHMLLGGERVKVGERFSNGCRYPGDPEAPYAETANCRCTLIAAVEGVGTSDAQRWSKLPEGMSYEEWKRAREFKPVAIEVDEKTPCLRRLADNTIVQTSVETVHPKKGDFRSWKFKWHEPEEDGCTIRALYAESDNRVQGLVALKENKRDSLVEVKLVESAPHNIKYGGLSGVKEYSGVGAHLFAEAVKESYKKGYNGFVSFLAKNTLFEHYEKELGATRIGDSQRMYIDEAAAKVLHERYYGDIPR